MRNQRTFSLEFKSQVIEELLSGASRPAQLCRIYNISSSLLYHWKKQYSRGKFCNEPTEERALKDRIEKLEQLVGRLTLENEFLKKGLQNSLSQSRRNGKSSSASSTPSGIPSGGCGLMKLVRSTFYYRRKGKSPDQMKAEVDLRDRIEAICLEFPRYRYRRVTHQLKRDGWLVNYKKVLKLMRESDLLCQVKRR